ncbi:MAG TPA: PilC/PilY family type IV pilus protein [Steroidobacteraceae bacterium]|nr:PilC/PilY family type IV pilus protein [Steroidobacteraceae bacterium]
MTRSAALLAGIFAAAAACADADEAWLQRATVPDGLNPLLAVILDRSAATARTIPAAEDYDPARDYGPDVPEALRCDPAKVYFRRGPGPAPDCAAEAGVELWPRAAASGQHCDAARAPLAAAGFFVASRLAQWRASAEGGYWGAPSAGNEGALECRADRGRHGDSAGRWYASDGTGTPWTAAPEREIPWDRPPFADAFILYAGNFLNYLRAGTAPVDHPMAELQATRLAAALASTADLDVALLRIDDDGPDGGYVARAPVPSATAAAEVAALAAAPTAGSAPLGETLTEAARWLAGAARHFGTDGRADAASTLPAQPGTYRSPFDHACRPVTLGFVTPGESTDDDQAAAAAAALPGFEAETGGCGLDCLAALGAWLGTTDLRGDLPGAQSAPLAWLTSPADPLAYANLVATAFQRDAAPAAEPQLSAAAVLPFGRDAADAGVVFGLSAPRPRARWHGNHFRYALRAAESPLETPSIVDRAGEPAMDDASGLPRPGSQSLWSDVPDADLLAGGAAGRLPTLDARRVFSDVASPRLLEPGNRLDPGNARVGRAALGLAPGDPLSAAEVLAWFAGGRPPGDPGTDAPAIVDDAVTGTQVVLSANQDGLLQAIDAATGIERWAWIPKALLPRLPELLRDAPAMARSHGIDGALVLHQRDVNRDGRIDAVAGEHRWLLFGLGRGGPRYYAIDLALIDDPRLLWSLELDDAQLEARANPVVTRLPVAGSGQSAGDWVVLFAGGYDPRFDATRAEGRGAGAVLRLVDAASGRTLWSAGGPESDLPLAGLASLAAAPRALDLDGDGNLDRAYALDVTGSLWRFDFAESRAPAEAATARRIARLGTGEQRWFATPDVSVVGKGPASRLAIAAGSGWLARPRDTAIEDRVTVVFDPIAGDTGGELTEGDLYDATGAGDGLPPDAPGWFIRLAAHGAGEKLAGETVTFDGALHFATYEPLPAEDGAPCGPPRSIARRYAVDLATALPRNTVVESEEEDQPDEIEASGLPAAIRFGFPARSGESCVGCRPRPFGIAGAASFDTGYAGDPVRTSWRKLAPPASP